MCFGDATTKTIIVRHVQQVHTEEQLSGVQEVRVRIDEAGCDKTAVQILERGRWSCNRLHVLPRTQRNHPTLMDGERLGPAGGLESQVPQIYKRTTPPLVEHYGFNEEDIVFFRLHIVADTEHGKRGYEIVERLANTEEKKEACLRAVREATLMRRLYLDALYDEFRDPNYAAVPLLRRMVVAGQLGRKSGRGFYDYS